LGGEEEGKGTPEEEPIPYSLSDGGRGKKSSSGEKLSTLLETLVVESGLSEYHKSKDDFAGTQKLLNMEELANASSLYPLSMQGLSEFLETIELDRSFQSAEGGENKDAVNLITMHNTKGLEFPLVIVTGLEQGLFPREDEEGEALEEQRRLMYVSATRAKDTLYLTACRWRRIRGRLFETQPSRFLLEMDRSLYQLWRGGSARRGIPTSPAPSTAQTGRTEQQGASPADGGWKQGQTVYHDEYGQGVVVKASETESSGTLVVVRFESGKTAQFFPKYTRKLEKIKE